MTLFDQAKEMIEEYLADPQQDGEKYFEQTVAAINAGTPRQVEGESFKYIDRFGEREIESKYFINTKDMILVVSTETHTLERETGITAKTEALDIYDLEQGKCLHVTYHKPQSVHPFSINNTGIGMTVKPIHDQEDIKTFKDTITSIRQGTYKTPAKQICHLRLAAAV